MRGGIDFQILGFSDYQRWVWVKRCEGMKVVGGDAGDEIFFIVSKSHLEQLAPYLYPHGVAVECFRLVGDVDTQAAKCPIEGSGERVVGVVELVIAADKNTLGDIKVDACRTACKIPCAAYIFHFG